MNIRGMGRTSSSVKLIYHVQNTANGLVGCKRSFVFICKLYLILISCQLSHPLEYYGRLVLNIKTVPADGALPWEWHVVAQRESRPGQRRTLRLLVFGGVPTSLTLAVTAALRLLWGPHERGTESRACGTSTRSWGQARLRGNGGAGCANARHAEL